MPLHVVARLQFERFGQVSAAQRAAASRVVRATAFEIQADAQQRARVDTGAMRAGIYVAVGGELSGYQDAAAAAERANRGVEVVGPVEPETQDALSAVVAAAVEYTLHNEYGTSRMPAQPMLTPAAESARAGFGAAMARALGGAT